MRTRFRFSGVVIRKRISFLFFGALVLTVLLTTRLAYVQIVQHRDLTRLALEQRLRGVAADALRGPIYDRNMDALALSVSADAVYVRPVEITSKEATAAALAAILDLSRDDVMRRLQRNEAEVWIARRVSQEQAAAVRSAELPGVHLAQRTARVYPQGSLAAHVLGMVGIDNQGLEGLELYYDDVLRGTAGEALTERDAGGRIIPQGMSTFVNPVDGHGLVLTIDTAIQAVAERELERACIATLSEYCMTLWMDPRTGHVLALATYPSYDANAATAYPADVRRNRAIVDQFEPGSIFKVITSVAAMEEGVVAPDEGFFDRGFIEIGGGRVNCWRGGGHGSLTFAEAVEHSCNPVFAELGGLRLGPERFYPYLEAFGFGDRLGLDFPGEAKGQVPKPGEVVHGEVLQWANIGFGQGVAVSPLQIVSALATIANGGVRMQPQLVQGFVDPLTGAVEPVRRQPLQRVISEATARTFLTMMRATVETGSGTNAAVAGYNVGGKTGTSQIAEGGVYTEKRAASFIGVAPVEDPQLVGIVVLHDLQPRPAYGGVHAAPVWGAVAKEALPLLGVAPSVPTEDGDTPNALHVQVPNVQNLPRPQAELLLREAGLHGVARGLGTYVLSQTPGPGTAVARGTEVLLDFWDVPEHWRGETTVPDVRGRTMRQAAEALADVGLVLDIRGDGLFSVPEATLAARATEQTPAPGQRLLRGDRVAVKFVVAD